MKGIRHKVMKITWYNEGQAGTETDLMNGVANLAQS
jgi:hypothetical protein